LDETRASPQSFAASTAAAVANEFLALQDQDPGHPPIDNLKLQKLLFYAHAWHLAIHDKPLFEEDIEAWPWGPVVRNVYLEFMKFRNRPVQGRATEIQKAGPDILQWRFEESHITDANLKAFIKAVWDVHKKYTGIQLSNSTHAAGEPWAVIKEKYGNLDTKPTIPNGLIAEIFRAKIGNVERQPDHGS
jgi:uncharacterized phage-associated protein